MDLETLARRLDHERDPLVGDVEVLVLSPGGRRYQILSLNWDDANKTWLLVTDRTE